MIGLDLAPRGVAMSALPSSAHTPRLDAALDASAPQVRASAYVETFASAPEIPARADHVVLDFAARAMACRHCGASQPIAMPISVTVLVAMTDAFLERHANCLSDAEVGGTAGGAA